MTSYLIVEDERLAYLELKRMMDKLRPRYTFMQRTETIAATVGFLKNNDPGLILLDVSLSDGNSFEIFNHVNISTPIIFTTGYDEYALEAFRLNSIDYLLKPIEEEKLSVALNKFEQIYQYQSPRFNYKLLEEALPRQVKKRFLIQKGDSYSYIDAGEIAFFYSEDKVNFIHTFTDKRYIVNYTLDQLEQYLDPAIFFRASRNCITNIKAISKIVKYFNSRLKLSFQPQNPHEVLVSRVRVDDFLKWVDGII